MIPASEALQRLQDGNRRFVSDSRTSDILTSRANIRDLVSGQRPFAIILGCSDSRVPIEIIFDQGLGDLFVIRVAGNIVAPSLIGSIEYAAETTGARLVVVLGHSHCGAVTATLEELQRPSDSRSPNLHAIVKRIMPAVEPLTLEGPGQDPDSLAQKAVRANILASVAKLHSESEILEQQVKEQDLLIIGAEYSLETGTVEFLNSATGG